jgi:hypothetical protein
MTRSGVRFPSAPPAHRKSRRFPKCRRIPEVFIALATQRCYTRGIEEVGKPSGLVKRPGSAAWYFRQRWPKRFKRPGSLDEVWISLETASYQDALKRLGEARSEAQRRFREPEPRTGIYARTFRPSWPDQKSAPLLTAAHALPLAQSFFWKGMRAMDAETSLSSEISDDERFSWRMEVETMVARLAGPKPADGCDDVDGAMIAVLRQAGLRAEPDSEACNLLHNYLRRAMAQSYKIRLARSDGDFSDRIADSLFVAPMFVENTKAAKSLEPKDGQNGSALLDPALVDLWAKERKVLAKGVDKHRAVARWFYEQVGSIPVEAITKRDVLSFKKSMIEEGVSPANANAKLRTLLGYAVESDLLDANPAARVNIQDSDKARRKRKEFDLPALHALFGSPVYVLSLTRQFTGCSSFHVLLGAEECDHVKSVQRHFAVERMVEPLYPQILWQGAMSAQSRYSCKNPFSGEENWYDQTALG